MFTGIITDIGRIRAVTSLATDGDAGGGKRFEIETARDLTNVALGASIACAGACMTVVEKGKDGGKDWFAVEVSNESLSRTTLGVWDVGTAVNLEGALCLGDELGGHLVSGHVDDTAGVADAHAEGESLRLSFVAPKALMRYIAPKGSVVIDGVSLTVNEVEGDRFGVNLIAHTQKTTTLGDLQPGDTVNLEIDLLARYVARLLDKE